MNTSAAVGLLPSFYFTLAAICAGVT